MKDDTFLDDIGRSAANFGRAAIGQGAMMGWGDEAEAWLRSKLGQEPYPEQLAKVRQGYGQYAAEHGFIAPVAEFAGGALPAVASLAIPGLQAGAPGAISGLVAQGAKAVGLGALQGGVAGAGSAEEGGRVSGAVTGAVLGGALGAAVPMGTGAVKSSYDWLAERLGPSADRIERSAAAKFNRALGESNMTPTEMIGVMGRDEALGVPSVLANTSFKLADLGKAVAKSPGPGSDKVEDTIRAQQYGGRERTYRQVDKALDPGDYFDDLEELARTKKAEAGPLYDKAYQYGEVTDPNVLKFLALPQFQDAIPMAQKYLAAKGEPWDISNSVTVKHLDNVKQGLDQLIESQTDATTGKVTKLGAVYVQKKNEFLDALDASVPDYAKARAAFRGKSELESAAKEGYKNFGRKTHEEIIKRVGGMKGGEREAYRTGVARKLYADIMNPQGSPNSAGKIIGPPESQAKLQALFDDPAQYRLFKAALERESQLHQQATRMFSGSDTSKNLQAREMLEQSEGGSLGGAIVGGIASGGFLQSLPGMVSRFISTASMTPKVADKLATMLMSKEPDEVAAVVTMLEKHAAREVPKKAASAALNRGIVGGTASAIFAPPQIGLSIGPDFPENLDEYTSQVEQQFDPGDEFPESLDDFK